MSLNKAFNRKKKQQIIKSQVAEVNKEQALTYTAQLQKFTKNLEEFGQKYKNEIQYNSDFREKFYSMCIEIGVDPLASISLWSKTLNNLSEFYYNLAIQIITISMTKGPLIEINDLKQMLMKNMKTKDISNKDIENAIESVSELKCGFQIITVKNSKAVVTVPMEKNSTAEDIISLASENNGWIGFSICNLKKGMKLIEFQNAIESLLSHGVAWEDKQCFIKEETKNDDVIYWFPGLTENK